jgi:Phage tail sheath protein subtilisin-like domain
VTVTQYLSPGVYGIETTPAPAPLGLSPAKMGIVGWTDNGPSNFPMQVQSVQEFTNLFGPVSTLGLVPIEIQAFFGNGGQAAWVNRVVPSDAVAASVAIDANPGPTKWTFTALGEGIWGNNLQVRIRGNQNFLDPVTNQWDAFDVLILQPTTYDPTEDVASEVYEQVQFTDPSAYNYITNAIQDPRDPSTLVTLTQGIGGTPSGLLNVVVPSEAIGTGGGLPLASRFTGTLANIPILPGTLFITAVSDTINSLPLSPTLGTVNGTTTAFNFQLPISNLPIVEGSTQLYYQKLSISNENVTASISGAVDGSNTIFSMLIGGTANPVHRENAIYKLKYAATAGASPQPLSTLSTIALTLTLATGFTVGDSVNNGAGATGQILTVGGSNITVQIIGGTWAATGSITDTTTTHTTTYTAGVITPAAATYNLATRALTSTPVHPGTVSIAVNVQGVGLETITDNGAGVLTGNGGSLPLGGTINYTTGAMTGTTATLTAASTIVASYYMSNVITKDINNVVSVASTSPFTVGDNVTTTTPTTGTVVAINPTLSQLTISVTNTANQFPTSGTITDTTHAGTSTLTGVTYLDDVGQGVPLIGSINSGGTNTINLVDSVTTPHLSGAVNFQTATAPIPESNFFVDYVALGLVASSTAGVLSGDCTTNSTVNSDTGQIIITFSNPPLSGSTVDASFQQGQLVQDDGLGNIIGDVGAAPGSNVVNYNLGTVDVTFASPPPSGTPVVAEYVKLAQAIQFQLSGGSNGTAVSRNDISNPTLATVYNPNTGTTGTGIYALNTVDEPLNIVVPDFEGSAFVQNDIAAWADGQQNRFCIFTFANGTTVDEAIQYVLVTEAFDTRNAAIYYPNVNFINPLTNYPQLIPCSGFVAGVYSQTAQNKNVGKSPGGIVDGAINAPGVVGAELVLQQTDRDNLYQSRINPLISSAATGFAVWGVRTLSNDLRWRYINCRLLNNFLMYQIRLNLEWTVFENNGPALWTKITTSVTGYLNSLFRLGYFAGQTAAQAYFVICDSRNNNQQTVNSGMVNISVGYSANVPAEFVVFELSQPASTSTV